MCQQANVGRLSRNSAEREAGKPLPEMFAATWSGEYWIFRKQDVIVRRISFLSMIEGGLKWEHTMKPSHYDALLTFARLLSEVQSGAPKISWQKITPISKKDHQQAWKHLFYIIFFRLLCRDGHYGILVNSAPLRLACCFGRYCPATRYGC